MRDPLQIGEGVGSKVSGVCSGIIAETIPWLEPAACWDSWERPVGFALADQGSHAVSDEQKAVSKHFASLRGEKGQVLQGERARMTRNFQR